MVDKIKQITGPDRQDLEAATSKVVEGDGGGLGHAGFRARSTRRIRLGIDPRRLRHIRCLRRKRNEPRGM